MFERIFGGSPLRTSLPIHAPLRADPAPAQTLWVPEGSDLTLGLKLATNEVAERVLTRGACPDERCV